MIRFIYADQLTSEPALASSMFNDRRRQFKERLNWDITVGDDGQERDEYDDMNPLYIIWQRPNGLHGGSMRVLPTVGRTMVNEHFAHLSDGVAIASPLIWECTRFCISPDAEDGRKVAGALMLAGCELGLRFGLTDSVGVFDNRMIRIYRNIGWEPTVTGTEGTGKDAISVGLWPITPECRASIADKTGFEVTAARDWFEASFPSQMPLAA